MASIMYYHATFWKEIKENEDTKKHMQEIMLFASKASYGVIKLQLEAPPPAPVQQEYYEEPTPEPAPAPESEKLELPKD